MSKQDYFNFEKTAFLYLTLEIKDKKVQAFMKKFTGNIISAINHPECSSSEYLRLNEFTYHSGREAEFIVIHLSNIYILNFPEKYY